LPVTTKVTGHHTAEHTASPERRTALTPADTHRNQRTGMPAGSVAAGPGAAGPGARAGPAPLWTSLPVIR